MHVYVSSAAAAQQGVCVCVSVWGESRQGCDPGPGFISPDGTPPPRLRICTPPLWTPRAPRSRAELRAGRRAARNQL